MAIARTARELRRWSDLAAIHRRIAELAPELAGREIGLAEVAELCRRRARSQPGCDWQLTREQILIIGCEWQLQADSLESQSDTCLDCLARFLARLDA